MGSSRISRRWRARIGKHVGMRCVFSRNIPILSREWPWSVQTNGRKWWLCFSPELLFFRPKPAILQLQRSLQPGTGPGLVRVAVPPLKVTDPIAVLPSQDGTSTVRRHSIRLVTDRKDAQKSMVWGIPRHFPPPGYGATTSNGRIISLSSCSRMWQCQT